MAPTIVVEKDGLLPSTIVYDSEYQHVYEGSSNSKKSKSFSPLRATVYLALSLLATCIALSFFEFKLPELAFPGDLEVGTGSADLCPQPPALEPSKHAELWSSLNETYGTEEYVKRAVDWLAGAIRIPTESYDKMGPVGEDPRWEAFGPFHDYLLSAFPNVHATLAQTKVNTYGLVYEWKGSDASLKPLLLTAHQDVVPVNPDTVDEWTHPPYSGHYDGKLLWGRGTSDDKNGLIGVLSTVETLIENGFKPTRSIVLAFGFDEEASGLHGASTLATHLLKTYGENAFAFLVDEGGDYMNEFGKTYATPGIAEKGYLDVRVEVESPGGHSSVPPSHTTIGILSALLVKYEENPYTPRIGRGTPMYIKAQCLAVHAPELPSDLRKALKNSVKSDKALRKAEEILFEDRMFKALVGTTQAIDLISGGVKTNALPESAWAVVNHRIATDSSLDEVQEHDTNLLKDIAAEFNLSYTAFGKDITDEDAPSYGKLTLSDAWGAGLAPAPITPTGKDAAPFQLLAGTIKATYNAHRGGKDVIVSPGIMSGNTDTRYYWKLTPHIFRYNHHYTGDTSLFKDIHTVNEFIEVDAYIEMIKFFTILILNADESTSL
ncbi:carboxypeptidase S [Panus rudis PR-1116 ss-1]|nr:carboxypeptidase S [Panus rudis PR-1116 ss-1]